jgi:hypothetical protein
MAEVHVGPFIADMALAPGDAAFVEGHEAIPVSPGVSGQGSCPQVGCQLALRVPRKVVDSNEIDWFLAEQYSSQRNILKTLEPA